MSRSSMTSSEGAWIFSPLMLSPQEGMSGSLTCDQEEVHVPTTSTTTTYTLQYLLLGAFSA